MLNRDRRLESVGIWGKLASVDIKIAIFITSWCSTLLQFCYMLGYLCDITTKVAFHPKVQFLCLGPGGELSNWEFTESTKGMIVFLSFLLESGKGCTTTISCDQIVVEVISSFLPSSMSF